MNREIRSLNETSILKLVAKEICEDLQAIAINAPILIHEIDLLLDMLNSNQDARLPS